MLYYKILIFLTIINNHVILFSYHQQKNSKNNYQTTKSISNWFFLTAKELIADTILLHYYLASLTTVKVATVTIPCYIIARMYDHSMQSSFYDEVHHKNKHQLLSKQTCSIVNNISHSLVYALGSLVFFASDPKLKLTSLMSSVGILSALVMKDIIKTGKTDSNIRPWHEDFSCTKRSHGGFPSGHMIEASYLATLWGLQYGSIMAIPLSLFALASGIILVNCNRHYASQVIAGAGFGIAYGLASYAVVNQKLTEHGNIQLQYDRCGNPQLQLSYCW